MIQTKFLLTLVAILMFLIGIVVLTQSMQGNQANVVEARAKLCNSYYNYVDTTHEVIKPVDALCWRGDAPVRGDVQ